MLFGVAYGTLVMAINRQLMKPRRPVVIYMYSFCLRSHTHYEGIRRERAYSPF